MKHLFRKACDYAKFNKHSSKEAILKLMLDAAIKKTKHNEGVNIEACTIVDVVLEGVDNWSNKVNSGIASAK